MMPRKNYYGRKKESEEILGRASLRTRELYKDATTSSVEEGEDISVPSTQFIETELVKEDDCASQISVDEMSIHENDSAEDNPESILVDSDVSYSSVNSESDADISDIDISDTDISDTDSSINSDSCSELSDIPEEFGNIKENLIEWSLNFNISHAAVSSLLKVLRRHHPEDNLPLTAKTLLETDRRLNVTKLSEKESYKYFGISKGLKSLIERHPFELRVVHLLFNVDGLPVYKSSSLQFWNILCSVKELDSEPYIVALYSGDSKPPLDFYMRDFISESLKLETDGLQCEGFKVTVKIELFICDAPARQFLKNCKGHTAYHGCEKCYVVGIYKNHSMSYQNSNCDLRTDEDFRTMSQEEHHRSEIPSPLSNAGFDMVSSFSLDYLHLVLLGVMKRLFTLWLKKIPHKWSCRMVQDVSSAYVGLKSRVPAEFSRKPRSLKEFERFKGTELRLFLVYLGPVVMKDFVEGKVYRHFMLLSCAIRILCDPDMVKDDKMTDYAEQLLRKFVDTYQVVYPGSNVVYNVHNLIHLANDVRHNGDLDSSSAFRFENYLGKIKRLVRSGNLPAEQVCGRISELEKTQDRLQSKKFRSDELKIKPKNKKDDCFLLKDGSCGIVTQVSGSKLHFRKLTRSDDYFRYPCGSSMLGINLFRRLSPDICYINSRDIKRKCFRFKVKDDHLVVPFLS